MKVYITNTTIDLATMEAKSTHRVEWWAGNAKQRRRARRDEKRGCVVRLGVSKPERTTSTEAVLRTHTPPAGPSADTPTPPPTT